MRGFKFEKGLKARLMRCFKILRLGLSYEMAVKKAGVKAQSVEKAEAVRDLYNLEVGAAELIDFLRAARSSFYKMLENGEIAGRKSEGVYILGEAAESYYKAKFGGDGLRAARLRRELAAAEIKELDLAERKGELINAAKVAKDWADNVLNVRAKLLAMPGKLAPVLADVDEADAEQIVKAEVYDVLRDLAGNYKDGGEADEL